MIAQELEVTLHMAFMDARQKRHEFISVEHLLMAMLDNPSAAEVLRACGADLMMIVTSSSAAAARSRLRLRHPRSAPGGTRDRGR